MREEENIFFDDAGGWIKTARRFCCTRLTLCA